MFSRAIGLSLFIAAFRMAELRGFGAVCEKTMASPFGFLGPPFVWEIARSVGGPRHGRGIDGSHWNRPVRAGVRLAVLDQRQRHYSRLTTPRVAG
jgi:hypothetical protein